MFNSHPLIRTAGRVSPRNSTLLVGTGCPLRVVVVAAAVGSVTLVSGQSERSKSKNCRTTLRAIQLGN